MENKALITKVFKAMAPIIRLLESRINTMDTKLQSLSLAHKQDYLISITKKTCKLNEAILAMAKKLRPHGSKHRSTLKGGMYRGHQLVRHQPQQLAHRYNQRQVHHGVNRRHTRRERRAPRFNQWAAKPLFIFGGGIAIGLIIYKLILPLVFKKTPGAVARVSGKLAEAVAVQVAHGISWTSGATVGAIQHLTSFFDFSSQEVQFYQPILRNSHGNAYPIYPAVTGAVEGWPEGPDYEAYSLPTGWLGKPSVSLDPSSQLSRINSTPYIPPAVDPPHIRYLANSVRNMNFSGNFGHFVESLLESAIDNETKNIFFILSIIGGITLSVGVLILIDRHRASIAIQMLNIEEREAILENGPAQNLNHVRQLELNQARLLGRLDALQQLLGATGNPALPVLQGIAAGVQLANAGPPAQSPALLRNALPVQAPVLQEVLNEYNVD